MMPHKNTRKRSTVQWLEKATKDLAVGKFLLRKGEAYFDFACFHCQQCTEKAIKAFLVWHDTPFRRIHDLVSLGAQCLSIDSSLEETFKSTAILSRYAVDARYPGEDDEKYTAEQTQEALVMAERVLREVLRRLPLQLSVEKDTLSKKNNTSRTKK